MVDTLQADIYSFSEWYKVPVIVLGGMAAFVFYHRDRTDWVTLILVYIFMGWGSDQYGYPEGLCK